MTSPPVALPAARKPRVRSVPAYVSSAGQEAVELAASAGLVLDPWQADVLTGALGERQDGRWSAFEVALLVGRQNGKGAILEARELAGLLLFGERLIMHTAHEVKTAMEAFRRIESLFLNSDDLRRRVKKVTHANGDEGIELRDGARLRFVARSKRSGRGFTGDLIILDEALELTADQMEALMPTMSARDNPQLWYTSSPPLDPVSGAQLFGVRERGLVGAGDLAYFDFGAEGDLGDLSGIDLDDRELWAATNPALGIRVSEEFIARERAAMSPEGFARERLGIWPARHSGASVIDPVAWAGLVDLDSRRAEGVAFAVDITPSRDSASIVAVGPRSDGLLHAELVDHREGTDWLVARLVQLRKRHNPVGIGLDLRGPAGTLFTDLVKAGICKPEDAEKPKRGDLAIPAWMDVAAACGQIVDAVTQGTLRHIDQAPLNVAVAGAKTRQVGDAWGWARRIATVDISPLVAMTVARWVWETRAHLVSETYDPLDNIW